MQINDWQSHVQQQKREECKYPQGNGVIEMYKRGTIQIRLQKTLQIFMKPSINVQLFQQAETGIPIKN